MALNYGSIHIERGTGNAMNFYGYWELDTEWIDVEITHFPGDTHNGYGLGAVKRVVYIVDAKTTSTSDMETMLSTVNSLNTAPFTLELQIESADYFKCDGSTTSMEVMARKISKLKRVTQGYGTPSVYTIPFMILEEAG